LTAELGNEVGISPEELAQRFPKLYHMAEAGTWESIRKHGLLSTSGLLDLFEIDGTERVRIGSERRPESIIISHSKYGTAIIRDQKPLRESALLSCLTDMTPRQWYEALNRRVFFWLTRERLLTLLNARAYRGKTHCVLTIDTAELVARHYDRISLSPINSGSTIYTPQPRGGNTFLAPSAYPFKSRYKLRGAKNAIAELAVDYAVFDIAELVIRVDHMSGGRVLKKLYER
jgi:hypothetical protein